MHIEGYCPMGCGETLHVESFRIVCGDKDCPNPVSVSTILDDPETEHIVTLTSNNFAIKHPPRERIGDKISDCDLHHRIVNEPLPAAVRYTEGTFRVVYGDIDQYSAPLLDNGWYWEPLSMVGESRPTRERKTQ